MRSRYRKRQSLTSPRLRPDRTLVWQLKRRKRVLVTVLPARLVAVHEDVALWCLVQGLLEKSIVWRNNRNAQRSDSSMTPTRILVMWGKAATSNTIWVVNVLLITFLIRFKEKMYWLLMYYIVMTIKMVHLPLFLLIDHSILRMKRWHLCQLSRQEHQRQWLELLPNSLTQTHHPLSILRINIYLFHS